MEIIQVQKDSNSEHSSSNNRGRVLLLNRRSTVELGLLLLAGATLPKIYESAKESDFLDNSGSLSALDHCESMSSLGYLEYRVGEHRVQRELYAPEYDISSKEIAYDSLLIEPIPVLVEEPARYRSGTHEVLELNIQLNPDVEISDWTPDDRTSRSALTNCAMLAFDERTVQSPCEALRLYPTETILLDLRGTSSTVNQIVVKPPNASCATFRVRVDFDDSTACNQFLENFRSGIQTIPVYREVVIPLASWMRLQADVRSNLERQLSSRLNLSGDHRADQDKIILFDEAVKIFSESCTSVVKKVEGSDLEAYRNFRDVLSEAQIADSARALQPTRLEGMELQRQFRENDYVKSAILNALNSVLSDVIKQRNADSVKKEISQFDQDSSAVTSGGIHELSKARSTQSSGSLLNPVFKSKDGKVFLINGDVSEVESESSTTYDQLSTQEIVNSVVDRLAKSSEFELVKGTSVGEVEVKSVTGVTVGDLMSRAQQFTHSSVLVGVGERKILTRIADLDGRYLASHHTQGLLDKLTERSNWLKELENEKSEERCRQNTIDGIWNKLLKSQKDLSYAISALGKSSDIFSIWLDFKGKILEHAVYTAMNLSPVDLEEYVPTANRAVIPLDPMSNLFDDSALEKRADEELVEYQRRAEEILKKNQYFLDKAKEKLLIEIVQSCRILANIEYQGPNGSRSLYDSFDDRYGLNHEMRRWTKAEFDTNFPLKANLSELVDYCYSRNLFSSEELLFALRESSDLNLSKYDFGQGLMGERYLSRP